MWITLRCLVKPKFDLACHFLTQHVQHVERVMTNVSNHACSNVADDKEAIVLACTRLVFCSLDLHQSQEQLREKVRWTYTPQSTLWRRP